MDNNGGAPQATANQQEIELMKQLLLSSMSKDIEAAPRWSNESADKSSCSIFRVPQTLGMDNNGGAPQATANQQEIELMKQLLLPSMSKDIEAAPRWSNESADKSSCSIFRVPQTLAGGIAKACQPHIISIGPYHHGESQLQMLQGHKWRYLHTMLDRTQKYGIHLENLINVVASKEKKIRQCYSESTDNFTGPDLVKMMILDGCFIIEFLRQSYFPSRQSYFPSQNMLMINLFASVSVKQDLLRLENQVPYFVLENLFETIKVPGETLSLADLASSFFGFFLKGTRNVRNRPIDPKGVHLLDLFRLSLICSDQQDNYPVDESSSYDMIRSASELHRVGIRFKQTEASTILEIKFNRKRRTIEIPQMEKYDDDLIWILPNTVAFEQCCSWDASFARQMMYNFCVTIKSSRISA